MAESGEAYRESVGAAVRRLRGERGWPLRELGKVSGISVPYLSEIERGRKEPSAAMLAQLAEAFALSLAQLLVEIAQTLDRQIESRLEASPHRELLGQVETLDEADLVELTRYLDYLRWRRANGDDRGAP